MKDVIRALMLRELETFVREIELFPDDVTLWQTLPGIVNSAGNLGLHVAGNLEHFVGAILGETGYVRNRDLEFSRRAGSRSEVIAALQAARATVARVLDQLPEGRLDEMYPQPILERRLNTGLFLTHLVSHLAFHLGQAGYLRRAITGEATSAGGVATAALPAGANPAG